ncbi:hypothetical protein DL96DRAFT_1634467 [Flagelloscypha sp. PMI_526]|nr:hypothetical protein DL96DRAFT_1634467 [Flagelloscypha sp. PMI_526]
MPILTWILPAHFLTYSSLLGMQLYQSFVMTKLAFLHLPLPQFRSLQKKVFPFYFKSQTGLLLGVMATYPWLFTKSSVISKTDSTCFAVAVGTSLLNTFVYGPRTNTTMIERVHQETRDTTAVPKAERPGETASMSDEMKLLNRKFSRNHAMSIHLNAITILASLAYGISFISKLEVQQ